jgi:hypothetical protein
LSGLDGALSCSFELEQQGRILGTIAASNSLEAQVLSDQVITCPISRTAAKALGRHAAVEGLRVLARLSLSPTNGELRASKVEIPLLSSPDAAARNHFELSMPLNLLGAARPWVSAYSAREQQAAVSTLRSVQLDAAPTRISSGAGSTLYSTVVTCQFSVDKTFGGSSALPIGQVITLIPRARTTAQGLSADELECEFPIMERPGDGGKVFVRLSAEQGLPVAERLLIEQATQSNSFRGYVINGEVAAELAVLDLPIPTVIRPSIVLNLASV